MAAHLSEQVTSPRQQHPELPVDLEQVVLRCLQKEPGQRFQDVVDVEEALARCACSAVWSSDKAEDWWQARAEPASQSGLAKSCLQSSSDKRQLHSRGP
jgi:serine/threonine-protein kinase